MKLFTVQLRKIERGEENFIKGFIVSAGGRYDAPSVVRSNRMAQAVMEAVDTGVRDIGIIAEKRELLRSNFVEHDGWKGYHEYIFVDPPYEQPRQGRGLSQHVDSLQDAIEQRRRTFEHGDGQLSVEEAAEQAKEGKA